MKIAVIGSGNVGGALAEGWVRAGHRVTFGSRNASDSSPVKGAQVAAIPEAIAANDVVVLAVPSDAAAQVISAAKSWKGKTLIDCTNPIGPGFTLAVGHNTSGGEQVAAQAKEARVVKAFNTTGFDNMRNPVYAGKPTTMFFATDDNEARNTASQLIKDIGFEPVFVGPMKQSRYLEPMAMLWISMTGEHGRDFAFTMLKR